MSRRKDGLALLALRGRVSLDGKPKTRVALAVGTRVVLAGFCSLAVTALSLPARRLVLLGEPAVPHGPHLPLGRVVTLYGDGRAPVGWLDPDGAAHILGGAHGPRLRRPGRPDLALVPDAPYIMDGLSGFRLLEVESATSEVSTSDKGQFDQSLRIVVRFDTVHITTDAGKGTTLDGAAARVVTELAEIKAPVAWSELARILWSAPADAAIRHRWDQLLLRLRGKLREAGIRADLVRSNRGGLVELVLGPGDKLQVRT